jgi:hypothetical protein
MTLLCCGPLVRLPVLHESVQIVSPESARCLKDVSPALNLLVEVVATTPSDKEVSR